MLSMRLRSIGYMEGDRRGAAGVERGWESYLRGRRGWEKVVVDARVGDARPEERRQLVDEPKRRDPVPGRDFRLTIDLDIQQAISRRCVGNSLARRSSWRYGRVGFWGWCRSRPTIRTTSLVATGRTALRSAYRRCLQDPLKPMLDKTMSGAYPPGSTFKPFSALAALNERLVDVRSSVQCRGFYQFGKRVFKCTHVHGSVDLHASLVESCNVYFYQLGEHVGMDRIAKVGLDFGFGQKTGLGTNPEAAGRMPTKAWYAQHYRRFQMGFTLNAAIGQGATTVNPLQLALAYAAIANGGTLYEPQLVRAVETADGMVVQDFPPRVRRRVAHDQRTSRLCATRCGGWSMTTRGLPTRAACGHRRRRQDGHGAGLPQGGPRVGDDTRLWFFNRDHAWFAGYAPAVGSRDRHGGAHRTRRRWWHACCPGRVQTVQAYERLKAERAAKANTARIAGARVRAP